jgi:hypothetical protein
MTGKDLAILLAPMLLSLIISLGYAKSMAEKKMEFPKIFTKALSIHGRIMLLSAIGWVFYAAGWNTRMIGVLYLAIGFLIIGMIEYVSINKMTKKK